MKFYIDAEKRIHLNRTWNNDNSDDGWTNDKALSGEESDLAAEIRVYNQPYEFKALKLDEKSQPMEGAEFTLFRQVNAVSGSVRKDYLPMDGYESLISGPDGIIPRIDHTLPAGTYYLTEKTAPEGYEELSEDVLFTITDAGEVTLGNEVMGVTLDASTSDSDASTSGGKKTVYKLNIVNEPVYEAKILTIYKQVSGNFGNKEQEFTFTLTIGDGADTTTEYAWRKNGEKQTVKLKSGDTFTLRHGDQMKLLVSPGTEVTVTEEENDYKTTYAVGSGPKTDGKGATVTLEQDTKLTFTNSKNGLIPTGVFLGFCGLLLAGGCILFGMTASVRRKRRMKKL